MGRASHGRSALLALFLAAPLLICSCKGGDPSGTTSTTASGLPEDFRIADDDGNLVFQYFDPSTGKLRVASTRAEVPEGCRENVIVLSAALKRGEVPAGLVIMANLKEKEADGGYPYRLVSRYSVTQPGAPPEPSAKSAPVSPSGTAEADQVLLFVTPWCPHCRTAKQWLAGNGVAFREHDVEQDPGARQLLARLGREQGLPEHMLNSVPIIYVKGKLLLGFNAREVARLLGR